MRILDADDMATFNGSWTPLRQKDKSLGCVWFLWTSADWGDIGKPKTYVFWTQAIRSGYVQGMLSGPPCCTWPAARGKRDATLEQEGRQGPRKIRSAELLS
jgi:hypothetical protein